LAGHAIGAIATTTRFHFSHELSVDPHPVTKRHRRRLYGVDTSALKRKLTAMEMGRSAEIAADPCRVLRHDYPQAAQTTSLYGWPGAKPDLRPATAPPTFFP
jgi:hypothetical protein